MLLGLGSMLGTGVFVSIAIVAGIAGPAVVTAIVIAGILATCNGLSSAQLAASHPVAGGTYEYGYKYLTPTLGFTAGWTFLLAKSASAATAALGIAAYLQAATGWQIDNTFESITTVNQGYFGIRFAIAIGALVLTSGFVLGGVKRSNVMNLILISIAGVALITFIIACCNADRFAAPSLSHLLGQTSDANSEQSSITIGTLLSATALIFVAYTGYGRVATMGEEIREPQRNIPRAVLITLLVTASLYIAVAFAIVSVTNTDQLADITASASQTGGAALSMIANTQVNSTVGTIVSIGALAAMLGVLLNLVLGLSRIALAMGRRRDLPHVFASISKSGTTPVPAVLLVTIIIAILICIGDIKTTWSFSAFTVLIYYALANLAALRLKGEDQRYPRFIAIAGFIGCLGLAFFVPVQIWLTGGGLILLGLIWHWVMQRSNRPRIHK